jgi:hypothetical protein
MVIGLSVDKDVAFAALYIDRIVRIYKKGTGNDKD